MELTWAVPSQPNVSGYAVQRQADPDFVTIATTQDRFFLDVDDNGLNGGTNDLAQGTRYCYRIQALDGTGTVLASSVTTCAIFGQLGLWVPDTVGPMNGQATVPVNIRNADGLRIASTDLWLDFDASVITPTQISPAILATGYTWIYSVQPVADTTHRLKIVAIPDDLVDPPRLFGEGSLFNITFQVLGDEDDKSPLDLKDYVAPPAGQGGSVITTIVSDSQTVAVPLVLQDGLFVVGGEQAGYVRGDVTGNGVVNSEDAVTAMFMAVGLRTPTRLEVGAGDINGNGIIDGADAAMILYYAAFGQWPNLPLPRALAPAVASPMASDMAADLRLSSAQASPGETVDLVLSGESLQAMAAGDLVLIYDTSVVSGVVEVEKGERLKSIVGANVAFRDDGKGRINLSVAAPESLSGDGDLAILRLQLRADAPTGETVVNLAAASLYDLYGRDFVRSFPDNTLTRHSSTVTVGSQQHIYLPQVVR